MLVFDPQTGELLSRESLLLQPQTQVVDYYVLFLETGWTGDPEPGPEPSPSS